MKKREEYLTLRIPRPLLEQIKAQMKAERRGNRSEMVRILLEDGLARRCRLQAEAKWESDLEQDSDDIELWEHGKPE